VKRRAFTLIELLVVIGIIALLIAMLLPALKKARDQSITANCLSNLRQVGQYIAMYAQENSNLVPHTGYNASWNVRDVANNTLAAGIPSSAIRLGTWDERIVLSNIYKVKTDWNNGHFQIHGRPNSPFRCPGFGEGTYENGISGEDHSISAYGGYGMNAWYCKDGNFGFPPKDWECYWVKFTRVKPNKVLMADGYSRIQTSIYLMNASTKRGSYYVGSGYGVYLRHTNFRGANYLFGDLHAEWSAEYHKQKWSPPGGAGSSEASVWYVQSAEDDKWMFLEHQQPWP
jgi:prepilin-type N-terminal cleavage/methylation domain-containing protein/prepilin-type processing-associated H-X9-DG protein